MAIITRKANLIDIVVPGEVQSNFHLIPVLPLVGNDESSLAIYGKYVAGEENIKNFYDKKSKILKTLIGVKND